MGHNRGPAAGSKTELIKRAGNDVLDVRRQIQIVGDDLNDVADQLIGRHISAGVHQIWLSTEPNLFGQFPRARFVERGALRMLPKRTNPAIGATWPASGSTACGRDRRSPIVGLTPRPVEFQYRSAIGPTGQMVYSIRSYRDGRSTGARTQLAEKGFSPNCFAEFESPGERIMSMRARRAAGTCRWPG